MNPSEVLEAAASQSFCELSCQWFTFIVFGSVFSDGSEDCRETEPFPHAKRCLKQSQIQCTSATWPP